MPTPADWIEVCVPVTRATMLATPAGLMWFSTIPVAELLPLPAIVTLEITKDLVKLVPSIRMPLPATLLMLQGPIIKGLAALPVPPLTQAQPAKSPSL